MLPSLLPPMFFFLALLMTRYFSDKRHDYSIYYLCLGFLCISPGRANYYVYLLPVFFMIFTVIWTYILSKKPYIWIYLIIPSIQLGFLWSHYNHYVGVINPRWFLFITTFTLILSMLLTTKTEKTIWRIIINCTLVAVITASMVLFPTPTYTYTEGKEILARELGKAVTQPAKWNKVSGHQYNKIFPFKRQWEIYTDYYDHWYVFEVLDNKSITIYILNPMTGKWVMEVSKQID